MAFFDRFRVNPAIYWECTGFDEQGKPTHIAPVPVMVRWDGSFKKIIDAKGQEHICRAQLITPTLAPLGSYYKQGTLVDDQPVVPDGTAADPKTDPEAFEVKGTASTPTPRGDAVMYEAFM